MRRCQVRAAPSTPCSHISSCTDATTLTTSATKRSASSFTRASSRARCCTRSTAHCVRYEVRKAKMYEERRAAIKPIEQFWKTVLLGTAESAE